MNVTQEQLREAMKVNEYLARKRCASYPDDLISAGNEAIMQAMEHFDPSRGVKFASYARNWISRNQSREYTDLCKGVHLPHDIADYPKKAGIYSKYELDAPIEGKEGTDLEGKYSILHTDVNLDYDNAVRDITDDDKALENKELLQRAINSLSEKEKELIKLYYFEGKSQREIGILEGVGQKAIQIRLQSVVNRIKSITKKIKAGNLTIINNPVKKVRPIKKPEVKVETETCYYITEDGKQLITEDNKALVTETTLINKKGETAIVTNQKEFAQKYNISTGNLSELISGKRLSCKGWFTLTSINIKSKRGGIAKSFTLINPQGETIAIKNLKTFCDVNNLNVQAMYSVADGRRSSYNGWRKA